jgi:hypothetical protein
MAPLLLLGFLLGGMALVVYVIAADEKRFLARFDLPCWKETDYLRALPNFLQALHDNHFESAWPRRANAVSAGFMCFRANALLRKRPKAQRRAFLQQHIVLFGLLHSLAPFIRDFIFNEQQRIIGDRILQMEDTIERDRLISFLELLKAHRHDFYSHLDEFDRHTIGEIVDRRLMNNLRAAHAIFQEHGFSLLDDFTQLRRWEEMTGSELVQELPQLPARPSGQSRQLA